MEVITVGSAISSSCYSIHFVTDHFSSSVGHFVFQVSNTYFYYTTYNMVDVIQSKVSWMLYMARTTRAVSVTPVFNFLHSGGEQLGSVTFTYTTVPEFNAAVKVFDVHREQGVWIRLVYVEQGVVQISKEFNV